ncbi:AAA family ATPase [Granulosicoccus antarcticus]|uniref:Denitrification regulatory protein NirQ n=1 Tax=Granulosicoccus antarcticus IMCC3135 TaxID=1192854 RepID=A0A2Z2NVM1_9GAMM|nr:Denitrification regulatory protein NirQ [Granulosicoccus antarcticus IMCC3135]
MSVLETVNRLKSQLEASVVGQPKLVNRLLIALLVDGHLLVEGAPGLAKTRAIKALADRIEADFQRVQFTPDLLPADLTGTEVYRPADGTFAFQKGPLFNNLILADEVNRAPAKVQSALLEAMAEQQISVGHQTYPLPTPFMVMATQNPIEQEGTYPLPEAQLDRFLMQVVIDYPDSRNELKILRLVRAEALAASGAEQAEELEAVVDEVFALTDLFAARREVLEVFMSDDVENYIVRLIVASRKPARHDEDLARWLQYGASPRGTLCLDACARAHAWLDGRDFVTPGDVQAIIHDVLRHRLLLSFEAEADGITTDDVIDRLLRMIAVP